MILVFGNVLLSKNSGYDFYLSMTPILSLEISLFNDKENDILSVMIRGKSPCFRNEGAGLVISKRPIIPKG